jgi:hypothetical protein
MPEHLRATLIYALLTTGLLTAHTVAAQSASDPGVSVRTLSAQSLSPARPSLPAGQVWQCIRNGQRIFSDARCGDGATIRQLNDVNRMDAAPVSRAPRYAPSPGAYAAYAAPYPDEEAPVDPDPGYVTQTVTVVDRLPHVPRTREPHHHDPRVARGRTAHAPAH